VTSGKNPVCEAGGAVCKSKANSRVSHFQRTAVLFLCSFHGSYHGYAPKISYARHKFCQLH